MVETKLNGIAEKAKRCPEERFTSLAHLLNEEHLKICFGHIKANKATGIDGVTKDEYAKTLDSNLRNLVESMKRHAFRPAPSRRVYIPKQGSDKERPLGIPTLESKLVQMAIRRVLDRIYEPLFLDSSFGFRPGRSAHGALKKVDVLVRTRQYHWVVEADIEGYFDNVDHDYLMEFLKIKIADSNILRLIVRFLKAGIWEEGRTLKTETGTPQGGVISPLLANIYLHYVLDSWFEKEFKGACKGKSELVRYADDFIACFELEEDAQRFHEAIQERFKGYGLGINKDKTRVFAFSPSKLGKGSGTFDFLGFTHYVGLSRTGYPRMKRRTSGKRFRVKVAAFKEWIREVRSELPIKQIWEMVKLKLLGHYRYYGVTDNYKRISEYRYRVENLLYKWLNRRSQKKSMNWSRFKRYLERYPLPCPKIYVSVFA